jgi:hypothetical protein
MGLKSYYIDTSPLPSDKQEKAIDFIQKNAWTNAYVPHSKGCFQCEWEENINPSRFPLLSGCIVQPLP